DVAALDLAIGGRPLGKAGAARVLVRVLAGGVALLAAIGRHPDVLGYEAGPLHDVGLGLRQRHRVLAGYQPKPDRLAEGATAGRVDDLPPLRRAEVEPPASLGLASQGPAKDLPALPMPV